MDDDVDVDVAAAVGMPMAPSDLVRVDCGGRRAGAVARECFHVGPGDVEVVSGVDSSVDDIHVLPIRCPLYFWPRSWCVAPALLLTMPVCVAWFSPCIRTRRNSLRGCSARQWEHASRSGRSFSSADR